MERALPYFPLVGALLGALLAAFDWALAPVFSLQVRDALLLAVPALLTGMLHLDGFADCCDALLGVRSPERRLEILRDSRVGAYGVVGIALLLLARFAALGALNAGPLRELALILAPLLGRWAIVYAVARYPYARASGAGAAFSVRTAHLLAATVVAVALLTAATSVLYHSRPPLTAIMPVALLSLLTLAITLLWCTWARRRLGGGLTGDTYGALNEWVEVAVLLLAPVAITLAAHF
jgi:adenosylcobinamide-GDP ribazoletransferase